ncbi:MAG: hypothetical protein K5665_05510 [Saccharofermentans sp.]|nr:hypothetical protein [Saccharofermentans sp.]
MKRNSVPTIILLTAIYLAAGILLGNLAGWLLNLKGVITIFLLEIIFIGFAHLTNLFMFPIAKRTMEKGVKANNFGKTTTLFSDGTHRIKSMLCIDEETGRVAYTSALNPFKFQMAEAKELSKVRSGYARAPLGGTRYVYFEFYHGNNRMRIPTLATARIVYFVQSREVQDALAAGENFGNLILKFNPKACLTDDKINNRVMPFIKIGIPATICAGLSIFVAVVSMCGEIYISSLNGWKDDLLNNGMFAFVTVFIALALAVTGLILGIKGLKQAASDGPVRGLGFSKAATIISSIVIAVLLLTFALFIFV